METIIDIYNKAITYNKQNIGYEMDKDGNIWFRFIDIANILEYKSKRDTLRDHVQKENKTQLKNIRNTNKEKEQPATVYINETGLYGLLIKSRMKKALDFQLWLINDVLPKLRKYGKIELDKKIKDKLDDLNKVIAKLKKANRVLKNNMNNYKKYPKGSHIYVLKEEGKYKIGKTTDLKQRLSTYNIGKADKLEYSYYKKTKCAKEIEICLKAILNKYVYKGNKEFYTCSLNQIIKAIRLCSEAEKNCDKCNQINKDIQVGGSQTITSIVMEQYEKEYQDIIYKMMAE
jgi:prophage antirepressor-like protein